MACHNCEQEKDKLLNAYFQDQTIAPDGKLRPTFSRLIERADKAEAEITRLTALLEDRPKLAMEIRKAIHDWDGNREMQEKFEHSTFVADRLIAYLKPLGSRNKL